MQEREYLDFKDFRRFVKLLKARPEIDRLYKKLKNGNGGIFDFGVFEKFMREKQQVELAFLTARSHTNITCSRCFRKANCAPFSLNT